MRQEPTTWYMDNNNYLTKDFVDTFIENFLKSVVPGDENKTVENIKEHYDCANPAAPLTCARDFGLFRDDEMGDSTKLYNNQTLSFAELVFELIFKRNAYKDTESNIKPAVLICKYFDILNNLGDIEDESKILTSTECYNFLCGIDDYDEIDVEYVRHIIDERKYSPHNPELPIIERVPNNVYITSLFYSLCDTGLFVYGKKKGIIKPTDISRDLIHYISNNGAKMSSAPIKIGGNSNNVYQYLCDINNGILEIVPEIKLKSELDAQDVRGTFEYLFGIGIRKSFNWEKYFFSNCFAIYKSFYFVKNLAILKLFLTNRASGEMLFDYAQSSNYRIITKEKKVMIMPFTDTEHTPIENLQIANDKFEGDTINHNFFGMHIKELNNCLDTNNPHVCIGWSVLGDLTAVTTKSQIEELYDKHLPDRSSNSRGQDVGQICRFRFDMHTGDFVVYGDGSVGHIGIIDSDYYYEQQDDQVQSKDYINNRKVKWLKSVPYTEMPQNLRNAVGSAMSIFSLNEYKKEILSLLDENINTCSITFNTGYESEFARNRILFGAPGTGKSFTLNGDRKEILYGDREVDEETLDLSEYGEYERVTFHPDYSYANFVGTYKPVPCKDGITYEYVPGPFMRTYVKALLNSKTENPKPYLLIIEEINRANVAAVFGDVFQLLDRDENEVSEYPIQASEDVKKYLAKKLGGDPEDYAEIRIPDNMFIWATMNSADQGVFPMDTAFKRRWDFKYLGIDDSEDGISGKTVLLGMKIGTQDHRRVVEWNELRKAINEELLKYKVNEDKLMGPYFISKKNLPNGNIIDPEDFSRIFKNKVIMYLFDDAAKQKRVSLFEGCEEKSRNQYSKICNEFDEKGVLIFGNAISDRFTEIPEDDEQ